MKQTCLTAIVFLLLTLVGYAQDTLPPAFEIAADTAMVQVVPPGRIQYFTERGKQLTLQEVLRLQNPANFKTLPDDRDVEILPGKAFWMRYRISNATGKALGITIPGNTGRADVHIANGLGKWQHFTTGREIPYSERDGYKRIRHIAYTIPAHETVTVYERNVDSFQKTAIATSVGIEKNIREASYFENNDYMATIIKASVQFGFFLFAAFFNLFFFYVVREKVYLAYGLLLVVVALDLFSPSLLDVFFRNYPYFRLIDSFIGTTLAFSLFTIVALMFLRVPENYPRWNKVILSVMMVFLLLSAYRLFINRSASDVLFLIVRISRFAILLGIIVFLIAGLVKKNRVAFILALAMVPFLITFLLMLTRIADFVGLIDASITWAVLVLSWSLFQRYKYLQAENSRQAIEKEQERNELIAKQNEMLELQVAERTSALTRSLDELRQTQNQLIQSEKMASLGELTAGIAHEIQNPLNFVNNFSDVSRELLDEMDEELDKGDIVEARAIAADVKQNLEKIGHHGRRADGIVKGMLQHSRSSSAQKEPTDINALADEYLRLAYHGLRAKDKSFNAELVLDLDPSLRKANVVSQDMGRVLLNLFTNAFYATQEKMKSPPAPDGGEEAQYKPTVEVLTRQSGNSIEIIVKDNGMGIPDVIKDKIMQPFFTTKPTGSGTGLGLSLSYDIVVKGHGGSISAESAEGVFTTFTIRLPY
ncbi:ATP-binding protein [uncultured Flavobacterium sp.]|uniref:ATP-binding protein n=1 Tax=uncultured Flavobacterium sp. TaxID=165435 RepID=UPI0025E522CE|nr:ATP-binding protein [uncultured Flavobacterium sp.]